MPPSRVLVSRLLTRLVPRLFWPALGGLVACATPKPDAPNTPDAPPPAVRSAAADETCPARGPAPVSLPGVLPEHSTTAFWRARTPDDQLLSVAEIAVHNRALSLPGEPDAAPDVFAPEPPESTLTAARDRLAYLRARIAAREYVDAAGVSPPPSLFAETQPGAALDELRITLAPVPLRCGPTAAGLFTVPPNPAFDRNLCSTLPAQEALRVVARWPGGFLLARTRAALGFIAPDAPLSPPLSPAEAARWTAGPFAVTARALDARTGGTTVPLPAGLRLPSPAPGHVLAATSTGLLDAEIVPTDADADAAALVPTARPLTRHAFLEEAFRYLGGPYGWGGMNGGRDCSQFVLEVLGSFGLDLPRNSSQQGVTGSYTIDVPAEASERERQALLDAAQESGLVLLHLPGHIMFYLGRNAAGEPMALHAFAEYVEPCDGLPTAADKPRETLREVNRVGVSTLALGRGTSRRAFIERLAHLTVFGPPSPALSGLVTHRPGLPPEGPCPEKSAATLTVSPASPNAEQPVRIIAGTSDDPGPATLVLVAPNGERVRPPVRALGGPPFGRWTRLETPTPGEWTAMFGDADRVLACRRFTVAAKPPRGSAAEPESRGGDAGAVWRPRRTWDRGMETLFALFVEQLFRYPMDDDRTWPNLQVLLQDTDHNLLFDHLAPGEDAALKLAPDCADLPFLLRAYFAWKMRLPFAVRPCSKGGRGRPPQCGEAESSLMPREAAAGAPAFQRFADGHVRVNAQSASGRTHPDQDESDLYPVPLTREALRPGTVFADPYGHLLVIAQWLPQKAGGTGALIGAEAQPDATIGRRTFWRGSFLFLPDTKLGGAGFKAFRPVKVGADGTVTQTPNAGLRGWTAGAPPYSRQQYDGTMDDWYDTLDALANPRPVEPIVRADALVAALLESAVRRTKSVQNGEDFQAATPRQIAMPDGARIFQSKGPWEDFSTPSRDFRLLIALDTVLGFPDAVARRPGLFGLSPDDPAAIKQTVTSIHEHMKRALAARQFSYTRSDGTPFTLRLADLVERQSALEMAYNPNDCPEIRWGAPPGAPEAAPCRRRAPAEQVRRMEGLRRWFRTRTRPVE